MQLTLMLNRFDDGDTFSNRQYHLLNSLIVFHVLIELMEFLRSAKRKKELALLIVTIFISSLAEVISLGAVIPFLGVLTNPEKLYNLDILKPFFSFFSIQNSKDLLLPITIFFSTTIIFSGIMRFISLWLQTKLSFAIGADIRLKIIFLVTNI